MNTGDPFRSGVLGVMSPARFLCATPVKYATRVASHCAAFIASSLTNATCRYRSHTVLVMNKKITIRLSDR